MDITDIRDALEPGYEATPFTSIASPKAIDWQRGLDPRYKSGMKNKLRRAPKDGRLSFAPEVAAKNKLLFYDSDGDYYCILGDFGRSAVFPPTRRYGREEIRVFSAACKACELRGLHRCSESPFFCQRNGYVCDVTASILAAVHEDDGKHDKRFNFNFAPNLQTTSRQAADVMYIVTVTSESLAHPTFSGKPWPQKRALIAIASADDSWLCVVDLLQQRIGFLRQSDVSIIKRLTNAHINLTLDHIYARNIPFSMNRFCDWRFGKGVRPSSDPGEDPKDARLRPPTATSTWNLSSWVARHRRLRPIRVLPQSAFISLHAFVERLPTFLLREMGEDDMDVAPLRAVTSSDAFLDLPDIGYFLRAEPWLQKVYSSIPAGVDENWVEIPPLEASSQLSAPRAELDPNFCSESIPEQLQASAAKLSLSILIEEWLSALYLQDTVFASISALLTEYAVLFPVAASESPHLFQAFSVDFRSATEQQSSPSTSASSAQLSSDAPQAAATGRSKRPRKQPSNDSDREKDSKKPRKNARRVAFIPKKLDGWFRCPVCAGEPDSHSDCQGLAFRDVKTLKLEHLRTFHSYTLEFLKIGNGGTEVDQWHRIFEKIYPSWSRRSSTRCLPSPFHCGIRTHGVEHAIHTYLPHITQIGQEILRYRERCRKAIKAWGTSIPEAFSPRADEFTAPLPITTILDILETLRALCGEAGNSTDLVIGDPPAIGSRVPIPTVPDLASSQLPSTESLGPGFTSDFASAPSESFPYQDIGAPADPMMAQEAADHEVFFKQLMEDMSNPLSVRHVPASAEASQHLSAATLPLDTSMDRELQSLGSSGKVLVELWGESSANLPGLASATSGVGHHVTPPQAEPGVVDSDTVNPALLSDMPGTGSPGSAYTSTSSHTSSSQADPTQPTFCICAEHSKGCDIGKWKGGSIVCTCCGDFFFLAPTFPEDGSPTPGFDGPF